MRSTVNQSLVGCIMNTRSRLLSRDRYFCGQQAEDVVLGPVRSELLAPEAVGRFCELIRAWALLRARVWSGGRTRQLRPLTPRLPISKRLSRHALRAPRQCAH
jgi:hypothetical protein